MRGPIGCPRCWRDDADLDDVNLDLLCDEHLADYYEELQEARDELEERAERARHMREWHER